MKYNLKIIFFYVSMHLKKAVASIFFYMKTYSLVVLIDAVFKSLKVLTYLCFKPTNSKVITVQKFAN